MEVRSEIHQDKDYEQAFRELSEGNVLNALSCLEKALKRSDNRSWYSFLGFCIAKERGHLTKGYELCQMAIQYEPNNSYHYYFLARIHLVAKSKKAALQALRKGLAIGKNKEIAQLLEDLGCRKAPVFVKLHRDNCINKITGLLLSRLRLR